MLLLTNRCRAPKDLLFSDQSDKSPDSGLQADDEKSKWIRRPFPLVSQTKGSRLGPSEIAGWRGTVSGQSFTN